MRRRRCSAVGERSGGSRVTSEIVQSLRARFPDATREHEAAGALGEPGGEVQQRLQRSIIGPLRVVHQQQQRPLGGEVERQPVERVIDREAIAARERLLQSLARHPFEQASRDSMGEVDLSRSGARRQDLNAVIGGNAREQAGLADPRGALEDCHRTTSSAHLGRDCPQLSDLRTPFDEHSRTVLSGGGPDARAESARHAQAMNDPELTRRCRLDIAAALAETAMLSAGGEAVARAGALMCGAQSAVPVLVNIVLRVRPEAPAEPILDAAETFFAGRRSGYTLLVSTVDTDLIAAARDRGLVCMVERYPQMVCRQPPDERPGVRRVDDPEAAARYWDICRAAYPSLGIDASVFDGFPDALLLEPHVGAFLVADADGRPSACAMATLGHGIASVWWVGSEPTAAVVGSRQPPPSPPHSGRSRRARRWSPCRPPRWGRRCTGRWATRTSGAISSTFSRCRRHPPEACHATGRSPCELLAPGPPTIEIRHVKPPTHCISTRTTPVATEAGPVPA